MRDFDVRKALRRDLDEQHRDDARTRIVEEMGIWAGSVRVDIAVINGELSGYEIKSARDTLARLPAQQTLYSQVFDRVTLVVAEHHAEKAAKLVPSWWGTLVATSPREHEVFLRQTRPAFENPAVDPLQVARLLWRQEALAMLERRDLAKGYRSAPVDKLCRRLAAELPLDVIRLEVREALKARTNWSRKSVNDKSEMAIGVDLDPLRPSASAHAGTACDR
ncbi:sce7726 family protein [Bradyrhizobium murdochi]|uniref:sce7726 family protein n=1 Tax=Bradyrhizobium murdochi TaxID=1038859 RepID=UPI0006886776|nr:sce7726 family protein [Bradyrhizobium murdochi]